MPIEELKLIVALLICFCSFFITVMYINKLYDENKELKKIIEGLMEANADYSEMVNCFENELKGIKENEKI